MGETRTPNPLRELTPEASAYTNSATKAIKSKSKKPLERENLLNSKSLFFVCTKKDAYLKQNSRSLYDISSIHHLYQKVKLVLTKVS